VDEKKQRDPARQAFLGQMSGGPYGRTVMQIAWHHQSALCRHPHIYPSDIHVLIYLYTFLCLFVVRVSTALGVKHLIAQFGLTFTFTCLD
jgi:hypothetical protein